MGFLSKALPAVLWLMLPAALFSQGVPFQIVATVGDSTAAINNLSALTLAAPSASGEAVTTLRLTYTGSGRLGFSTAPTLLGPGAFTVDGGASFPANLGFGQSIQFAVRYRPTTTEAVSAQMNLLFFEVQQATGGAPSVTVNGLMSLSLVGTAPAISLGYALPTNLNTLPLASEETLRFPNTLVQSTVTATLLVVNQGSGSARLNQVELIGADFSLINLPLLPTTIPAGGVLQFGVRFSPKSVAASTGQLNVRLGNSTLLTVQLAAQGVNSLLRYEATQNGDTVVVQPGTRVQLPDTRPGAPSRLDVRVTNDGAVEATISSIGITGGGFSISESPLLPLTLSPGASAVVSLLFAINDVGTFTGRLRIGTETIEVAARSLGAQLQFSYSNAAGSGTVAPGGVIVFPTVSIGRASEVSLTVRNSGNEAAPIAAVALQDATSLVEVLDVPALPISLAADSSFTLRLRFSPNNTNFSAFVLRIDSAVINLTGQGSAPTALPSFSFVGASGAIDSLQQLQVGLTLSEPYPVALTGSLTLAVNPGELVADPAVQFSTGGQTVNFTIAAGATQAIFQNGTNRIRLQSGTVASTLTITPRFSTTGGFDLTPANPNALVLTQAARAPRILGATISATAGGFTLTILGITNTRALGELNLTLSPRSGATVANPQLRLSLANNSDIWFRSNASQAFGGQFQMQIPFTFSGGSTTPTLASLFERASFTLSNAAGVSTPFELTIQ